MFSLPSTAATTKSAALANLSVETKAPLEFNSAVANNNWPFSKAVWSIPILYVPAAIAVTFEATNSASCNVYKNPGNWVVPTLAALSPLMYLVSDNANVLPATPLFKYAPKYTTAVAAAPSFS